MENKVFLLANKSNFSTNKNTNIGVNLEHKGRVITGTDLAEKLSLYDLYNDERDNCTKFRLLFTLNPVCSNVLFNKITEIVKFEGSSNCKVIKKAAMSGVNLSGKTVSSAPVSRKQAIKNTEYSHPALADFTYHCGVDIFNNHILRANGFPFIGKLKYGSNANVYNTIEDIARDIDGNQIREIPYQSVSGNCVDSLIHVYNTDNIKSMYDAFDQDCIEKDGWFGFYNKTLIDIPNTTINSAITINRVINNEAPCSFIDMYPGRDLFQFTPKFNKYKNRLEYNWDYCITYPYRNEYEKFKEINNNTLGAIKIASATEAHNNNGDSIVQFTSSMKHNLRKGDYVTLYYNTRSVYGEPNIVNVPLRVYNIGTTSGDDKEHIFSIRFDDISDYFDIIEKGLAVKGGRRCNLFFKKYKNGMNCIYYFRIFKRLEGENGDPTSELTKMAYAQNIYGDNLSQLIYTDDIDTAGLVDNLGRELTEIYLTFVKTNRGYRNWYENNNFANSEVSHAFGKVTSGIDLPENVLDYNVRKLHNIDLSKVSANYSAGTYNVLKNFAKQPKPLEGGDADGIMLSGRSEFYGDIVEFSPSEYLETVIENVYHRFNTAQRETTNSEYYDFYEDVVVSDDYYGGFSVSCVTQNVAVNIKTGNEELIAANLCPEGYIYNPHNRIKLREVSDIIREAEASYINYDGSKAECEDNIEDTYINDGVETPILDEYGNPVKHESVTFIMPESYNITVGQTVAFYDIFKRENVWGVISEINGSTITANVKNGSIDHQKIEDNAYIISIMIEEAPEYAFYVPSYGKFVWREVLAPSQYTGDSDLLDIPFTNGSFYLHNNINFFVKRQDPNNEMFMQLPEEDYRGVGSVNVKNRKLTKRTRKKLDLSALQYIIDLFSNNCN